jgi:hypothetical protein
LLIGPRRAIADKIAKSSFLTLKTAGTSFFIAESLYFANFMPVLSPITVYKNSVHNISMSKSNKLTPQEQEELQKLEADVKFLRKRLGLD